VSKARGATRPWPSTIPGPIQPHRALPDAPQALGGRGSPTSAPDSKEDVDGSLELGVDGAPACVVAPPTPPWLPGLLPAGVLPRDPLSVAHDRLALLRRVVEASAGLPEVEAFVEAALAEVVHALDLDVAVLELASGSLGGVALYGWGPGGPLAPYACRDVSRTLIERARAAGQATTWHRDDPLEPTESARLLDIHCAAAVPALHPAPAAPDGVLYVDRRRPCPPWTRQDLDLLEILARLTVTWAHAQRAHGQPLLPPPGPGAGPTLPAPQPTLDELLTAPSMRRARATLKGIVQSDLPVLVVGETGTGKTLLCEAIARASGRLPVVRAMLGSSDDLNTTASELFGHEKGAFSGAVARRKGVVAHADGGTLIFDELLNLPLHAQRLLLDFTQFGTYRPLGYASHAPLHSRVRVLAATHGDLHEAIAAGRLRGDLYHRLAGVVVELPPLRARRDELGLLGEAILALHQAPSDPRPWSLGRDAVRALRDPRLTWPGNLRELGWVLMRARRRAAREAPRERTIRARHLGDLADEAPARDVPVAGAVAPESLRGGIQGIAAREPTSAWRQIQDLRRALDDAERHTLERLVDACDGVVSRAARALGVARTSLISRIHALTVPRAGDTPAPSAPRRHADEGDPGGRDQG